MRWVVGRFSIIISSTLALLWTFLSKGLLPIWAPERILVCFIREHYIISSLSYCHLTGATFYFLLLNVSSVFASVLHIFTWCAQREEKKICRQLCIYPIHLVTIHYYIVCSVLCALVCFEGRGGFCFFRAAPLYFTRRQVQCALAALGSCDFDTGILFLCVFCD